ncbi:hypothetical protein [Paenirhodobacter populi]|uniref:hypothetical protein n=1 Tax=Paenirhodobacter populi TaxID=2306993 RepID=UPI000FE35A13|nr:hypothetical protein [Sinirhodobacter populi]
MSFLQAAKYGADFSLPKTTNPVDITRIRCCTAMEGDVAMTSDNPVTRQTCPRHACMMARFARIGD